MKKILPVLTCMVIFMNCPGQILQKDPTQNYINLCKPCGGVEEVMKKKGTWTKAEDDKVFADKTFPRTQYKLVYTRIDSFLSLMKVAVPELSGMEAQWYHVLRGSSYMANGPVPY